MPILKALEPLIDFLNAICTEGNLLYFDNVSAPTASSSILSANGEMAIVDPILEAKPETPSPPPTPGLAIHQFPPRPASPHYTTPAWKIGLSHKYPVENLYVGEAELEVLAKVLTYAREAWDEVNAAIKTCQDFSDLAHNMLPLFEYWMRKCDDFEETSISPQTVDDTSTGYGTGHGGFEPLEDELGIE